jgi:hypothetical protein
MTFGSRVCVKRTGSCQCKLDRHDFTSIFLGYTVTDQNITYLDLNSGIVKSATMLSLTKPGTSNQPAPLQLNFSTTLDWKRK